MASKQQIMCFPSLLGKKILVPSASIAEVINLTMDEKLLNQPLLWRGKRIPVLCIEKESHQKMPILGDKHFLAIAHKHSENFSSGFYALLFQGLPQMLQIDKADIEAESLLSNDWFEYEIVHNDDKILIPNFLKIERFLEAL